MFRRLIWKYLTRRKKWVFVVVLASMIGASLPAALLNLSLYLDEQINQELRGFGANILITPRSAVLQVGSGTLDYGSLSGGMFINETEIAKITTVPSAGDILAYAPLLYGVVKVASQSVVLVGTWFDQDDVLRPWWQVTGPPITNREDNTSAFVGIDVARALNLSVGDHFDVTFGTNVSTLTVTGTVSTGGSEDEQVLANLHTVQEITKHVGVVHVIQVSALGDPARLEVLAEEIAGVMADVQATTVNQIVLADVQFVGKIELIMLLSTIGVVALSGIVLGSTMTATMMKRRGEIALMKAIGAGNRGITSLIVGEEIVVGLLGGALGFLAGYGLSQAIAWSTFNLVVGANPIVLLAAMLVSVGIIMLATGRPLRQALKVNPAIALRGN